MKKSLQNWFLVATAVVSLAAASAVHASRGDADHSGHERREGRGGSVWHDKHHSPETKAAKHLDKLKSRLNISAAQQAQWDAFASIVLAQAQKMSELHGDRSNARLTLPERLDRAEAQEKMRTEMRPQMTLALKNLYAVLDADQRKVLDRKGHWMHGEH